ncbi:hypothetical protein C8Q73DRAFT_709878 [Cubamyces lactineus]|nr:hypothetical protein C8Q73DRAFT_709878 [Cubamyces lactineus]
MLYTRHGVNKAAERLLGLICFDSSSGLPLPAIPRVRQTYTMISGFTVFDVVVGVTGLLALIGQCSYWIIKRRLPATKLRVLEDTLSDTQSLLTTCVEEGRLGGGNAAQHFRARLDDIKEKVSDVRLELSRASTYMDHFKTIMTGLPRRIDRLCQETTTIRVQISITSSERQLPGSQVAAIPTTDPSLADVSARSETPNLNDAISAGPATLGASVPVLTSSEVTSSSQCTVWDNDVCTSHREAAVGANVDAAVKRSAQPDTAMLVLSSVSSEPTSLMREDGRGDGSSLSEPLLPNTKDTILPSYRPTTKRMLHRKKRLNDAVARTRAFARFLRRSCA